MKRPLVLHIGLSKTGSSSIQHVLAEQRPALRAQGVHLARSPGRANHALLPAAVVNDPKILWGYHPATWEGLAPAVRIDRFRDEFAEEMSNLADDVARVVITAEQLGGVLREPDEVARLAELLGRYFDPVQVVVYIRRQDQHAASAYTEWLRGGVMRDPGLPEGGTQKHPEYDYGGLLDRWAGAFGQEAITPRIFARDRLVDGDVVADFLALTGIDLPLIDDDAARQSNLSLSAPAQCLLLAAGRRLEARAGETLWRDTPAWRHLATSVSEALPGRGWRPTRAEASAFLARFAATNEAARARFFPQQTDLFDMSVADLPGEATQVTQDAVLEAALDALLFEMQAGMRRDAKSAMAQYRLARRLNDRPAMRTALMRAVKFAPDLLAARLRLAEFFLEECDLRQAGQHAEAALRIAPDDTAARRLVRQVLGGKPVVAIGSDAG